MPLPALPSLSSFVSYVMHACLLHSPTIICAYVSLCSSKVLQ